MTRCAFLIMHPDFKADRDRASIHGADASIIGVSSLEEACTVAAGLEKEGIGCIELCGAFGEDGARRVMDAVGMRIPVGYIVHLPEMDEAYARAFPSERGRNFVIHRARCPDHVR